MLSATKSVAGPMCIKIKVVDRFQDEVCCPIMSYPPSVYELELNLSFHCRRKARQVLSVLRLRRLLCVPPCAVLCRVALSCAVLLSAPSCEMVWPGADGERNKTTALCDRNVSFQPARNIPSLCWCLPPVPPASAKQGDRDCYFLFRQNVCTSGSSSSRRRKQQQQQEQQAGSSTAARGSRQQQEEAGSSKRKQAAAAAAAAAGSSSSRRRKQQQQQEEAAAAAGGSSSSSNQRETNEKPGGPAPGRGWHGMTGTQRVELAYTRPNKIRTKLSAFNGISVFRSECAHGTVLALDSATVLLALVIGAYVMRASWNQLSSTTLSPQYARMLCVVPLLWWQHIVSKRLAEFIARKSCVPHRIRWPQNIWKNPERKWRSAQWHAATCCAREFRPGTANAIYIHLFICCQQWKQPRNAMVMMFARRSKRWSMISSQVVSLHGFPGFQNGILILCRTGMSLLLTFLLFRHLPT